MKWNHVKLYLILMAVIASLWALVFGLSLMPNLSSDSALRGVPPDLRIIAPQELLNKRFNLQRR
jgi:hypothetical protein